jgi:hypothetical protein
MAIQMQRIPFDTISCNFTPNTFMRLQELKQQWVAYENAYQTSWSNNGYYRYSSFEEKNLVLQGQILHIKVYPPQVYSNSNWALPEPSQ